MIKYQTEINSRFERCVCCDKRDFDGIMFTSVLGDGERYKDLFICDECFVIMIQCRSNVMEPYGENK